MNNLSEYRHETERASHSTAYLWEPVRSLILAANAKRIFEVGCGNGATASRLAQLGLTVTAIDSSVTGVDIASKRCPAAHFEVASAYDDLAARFGTFPIVLSLEVVEHCFYPRAFAKSVFNLTEPGGMAIISTPYHGYFKNIALAVSGKMDAHYSALWDYGHIKFWSIKTLRALLMEAGFERVTFKRVGRMPPLAKSMIAVAHKH